MRVPDEARAYGRAKARVCNWDVLQLDHRTCFGLFDGLRTKLAFNSASAGARFAI